MNKIALFLLVVGCTYLGMFLGVFVDDPYMKFDDLNPMKYIPLVVISLAVVLLVIAWRKERTKHETLRKWYYNRFDDAYKAGDEKAFDMLVENVVELLDAGIFDRKDLHHFFEWSFHYWDRKIQGVIRVCIRRKLEAKAWALKESRGARKALIHEFAFD